MGKRLKWFGLLFVTIGISVAVILLISGIASGAFMLIPMAAFFAVIFCGIGGFIAYLGISQLRQEREILSMGTQYMGKIFDYRPNRTVTVNGSPTLDLVVRYFEGSEMKEVIVPTGSLSESEYPHGATVRISVYKGKGALVPETVSQARIEGQEDLLNPDYDVLGTHPTTSVTCPGCGAPLEIPVGMSRICPFCGRKLRADK